ncbi:MAG: lipid-A-disaccharide synthase [Acidobacteriota bacterium]
MDLLISAGEASGDLHGSRLLRELRNARPRIRAFGMGGARLEAAGLERIVASEALSVFGVAEVLEKLPGLRKALGALDAAARGREPAGAILIDFPDFHGLLARRLRRRGVPLIYYISPQVWAWRRYRARRIAQRARRIITLFPFEAEIYRRLGADAVCAGHPLVEDVREGLAGPSPLPPKTRRRLVLLPGSRDTELRRHWNTMADAAAALASRFDLELIAIRAEELPERLFPRAAQRGICVVAGGLHPILASADLALVASGTVTLEAALCGTPMVVVYKTSAFTWAVARALVRLRWASLVNIVAGEAIVPELIQNDFTVDRLTAAGAQLLSEPERLEAMRAGLARVAQELGPPGASARAAELVLSALESRP